MGSYHAHFSPPQNLFPLPSRRRRNTSHDAGKAGCMGGRASHTSGLGPDIARLSCPHRSLLKEWSAELESSTCYGRALVERFAGSGLQEDLASCASKVREDLECDEQRLMAASPGVEGAAPFHSPSREHSRRRSQPRRSESALNIL